MTDQQATALVARVRELEAVVHGLKSALVEKCGVDARFIEHQTSEKRTAQESEQP